jgi:hypothetical protein
VTYPATAVTFLESKMVPLIMSISHDIFSNFLAENDMTIWLPQDISTISNWLAFLFQPLKLIRERDA